MDNELLMMAMSVVVAEEIARRTAKQSRTVDESKRKVKVIRIRDVEPGTVLDVPGSGVLRELVVVCGANNFLLDVVVDGELLTSGDFDWYSSISGFSEWIDAFENDGSYVIRLSNIYFSERLVVRYQPSPGLMGQQVKLSDVLAKIELY